MIDKKLPVYVWFVGAISQKEIEGVSSAQQVHGIVNDQVLVVHPGRQIPWTIEFQGIVYFDGDISLCGKRLKVKIVSHIKIAADAVQMIFISTPRFAAPSRAAITSFPAWSA